MIIALVCFIIFLFIVFKFNPLETFENVETQEEKDVREVKGIINKMVNKKCPNAEFYKSGNKYCAKISGIGSGCQEPLDKKKDWITAFGIFGGYASQLKGDNVSECTDQHGSTLAEWGLCDADRMAQIDSFGHDENKPIIDAINSACKFYAGSKK